MLTPIGIIANRTGNKENINQPQRKSLSSKKKKGNSQNIRAETRGDHIDITA